MSRLSEIRLTAKVNRLTGCITLVRRYNHEEDVIPNHPPGEVLQSLSFGTLLLSVWPNSSASKLDAPRPTDGDEILASWMLDASIRRDSLG